MCANCYKLCDLKQFLSSLHFVSGDSSSSPAELISHFAKVNSFDGEIDTQTLYFQECFSLAHSLSVLAGYKVFLSCSYFSVQFRL